MVGSEEVEGCSAMFALSYEWVAEWRNGGSGCIVYVRGQGKEV